MRKITFTQVSYMFLFVYVMGILMGKLLRIIFPSLDSLTPSLLEFAILVVVCQIGVNLLSSVCYTVYQKQTWRQTYKLNGFSRKQLGWSVLLFVLIQGVLLFIHYFIEVISFSLGHTYQMSVYPIADDFTSLLFLILCIGMIPPICEDLFFRGYLLTGSSEYGARFAIIYTAFVFALFHDNLFRFTEIFIYALIAGFIVYYTNSIFIGIIVHVLTNTSYVIGEYVMTGELTQELSKDIHTEGSYMYIRLALFALIALVALLLSLKVMRKIKGLAPDTVHKEHEYHQDMPLRKMLNVPMFIILFIFIVRVFTEF